MLAVELVASERSYEAAFAGYESKVRAFVEQNQDLAARMADGFAPKTRRALWSRNLMFAMLRAMPFKDVLFKFAMRDVGRAANAVVLRDHLACVG